MPRALSDGGIRLVIVEALSQTRIDGASFWLAPKAPVVALSLRYDRIDAFWYTLAHELGHLADGETAGQSLDVDLVGDKAKDARVDRPAAELRADAYAMNFLVPKKEMETFVKSVRPLYSKTKIAEFSARVGAHPGIVVGQLQHRGEIAYAHSRETLVKVRHMITETALTDGWGMVPPTE